MAYDGEEAATGVLGEAPGESSTDGPGQHAAGERSVAGDRSLFRAALSPSSIAIVGASDNPNKIGGRPLLFLSRFGFQGKVYPINPNRDEVQGVSTYPDVGSLPEAPDLAIVAVPGAQVAAAVDDCAARGVKVTIVMAAGYGETMDADAMAAERSMVARARAAGMRLVGPNSQGLANFGTGAIASFSTMFLEVPPEDGPVAIVSQSGLMSTAPYALLRSAGIGVRHAHATGNDADVTLSELALAVVQDPGVRLLLLYIESIRDADILAQAAAIARERDVPIVALKAGRTARGQAAARSHTGALVNEDRIVDAFFHRHGIWRVRDVHALVAGAGAYLKGWRPRGSRLAVVSNSGASCVMAADTAHEVKLDLAVLDPSTVTTLAGRLPSFATVTNPIDITAALLTDSALFGHILSALAVDPNVDSLLAALPVAGAGYDVPALVRAASEFAMRPDRAIVVATPLESVGSQFRAAGVPTFANQSDALAVLAQLTHHARLLRQGTAPRLVSPQPIALAGTGPCLDEAQSLHFLHSHGMPTVEWRLCDTEEEALSAYRTFGAPVVVKACSAAVPHKSDHDLVVLNVSDEASVGRAFLTLRRRMCELGADGGVIVAPMIRGGREFVLGAKVDPVFGPVLMIGDGGRYVEALGDVALMLAPATADEVRAALLSLRIAPILPGVRGEPPFDVEALCAAAVRLGEIIAAAREHVASIDLNPVMVGRRGKGVVVVDALVERQQPPHHARMED